MKISLPLLVLTLFIGGTSKAAFDYRIEAADASDLSTLGQTAFDFSATGSGTIKLFLVQRASLPSVATLFNSSTTNFSLVKTGSGNSVHSASGPHLFNTENGSTASLLNFNNSSFAPVDSGIVSGTTVHGIEVGTIDFSGPSGSLANFTFQDRNPLPSGDDIFVDGNKVDASVISSSNSNSAFSVAVPEPGSAGILALSALAFAVRRRKA